MTDPPPQASPQVVNPVPVPLSWIIETNTNYQPPLVVLRIFSATGQAIFHLDVEAAKAMANGLRNEAAMATSGLIVPPGGIVRA